MRNLLERIKTFINDESDLVASLGFTVVWAIGLYIVIRYLSGV